MPQSSWMMPVMPPEGPAGAAADAGAAPLPDACGVGVVPPTLALGADRVVPAPSGADDEGSLFATGVSSELLSEFNPSPDTPKLEAGGSDVPE